MSVHARTLSGAHKPNLLLADVRASRGRVARLNAVYLRGVVARLPLLAVLTVLLVTFKL